MKIINRATIIITVFTFGIGIGRGVQYYQTKDAEQKRQLEYMKIISDYIKIDSTFDRLKATMAEKCSVVVK